MNTPEIEARQAEVDAYSDWLTDNSPTLYMEYAH
jgi:hypothetical protein